MMSNTPSNQFHEHGCLCPKCSDTTSTRNVHEQLADAESRNRELEAKLADMTLSHGETQKMHDLTIKALTDLLDATGHSTWKRLFKAPSVERAIEQAKAVRGRAGNE
jgi:hypothetical protein